MRRLETSDGQARTQRRTGRRGAALLALLASFSAGSHLVAQTTGLVPLNDLGPGSYEGFPGGLYPGGRNAPPPAHQAAALQRAAEIVPRDAAGNPDPQGLVVMIAVGMSNTTHEFGAFERNEDADPDRNARVVLMDTGLGGQTALAISDPAASYWTVMTQRLAAMGLTPAQVQVAWLKEADANPPDNFPVHATALREELESIANILHDRFPHLGLCYVSSRIYGGYAPPGSLNPEPQAYESGFSVKWLIEDQINGDPGLNHGQLPGPVRSPLLLWGPYLWADGTTPRSDGLTWVLSDFEADRTHPAPSAEQKVAGLLSSFFASESTAVSWWPRTADAAIVPKDAVKDAYVSAASPNTNFGSSPQLLEQGGGSPINTYIGFDLGGVPRPVRLAKLSLRVLGGGGGRVSLVGDTSWSETGITFASAPPVGGGLVDMPGSSKDGTIGANVTNTVNADADGTISLALTTPAAGQASYHSREDAQPPRLVMVVPCTGGPDGDGDGREDLCDCAPGDGGAFARPPEIENLRWPTKSLLAWDTASGAAGAGTRYDVMCGDLEELSSFGTGPSDLCAADDLPAAQLTDTTALPAPGRGLYCLVRGQNVCGKGRYETSSDGRDRRTTVCS